MYGTSFSNLNVNLNQDFVKLSVSSSNVDIKLSGVIGTSIPNLSTNIINCGISVANVNQYFNLLGISTGISIANLNNYFNALGITTGTSISTLNQEIAFLGITNLNIGISLQNTINTLAVATGSTIPHLDQEIDNINNILGTSFLITGTTTTYYVFGPWGTTGSNITNGSTGTPTSTFQNVEATFQQIQDGIAILQDAYDAYLAFQSAWNTAQALYNKYVLGYEALNDANIATIEGDIITLDGEVATNTASIGVIDASLIVIEAEIAGLTAYETISGVSISNLAGSIVNDENNITLLGSSFGSNYNAIINLGVSVRILTILKFLLDIGK